MRSQDKKRILTGTVIVGLICIIIVVLTAYSAELRCENNELIDSNEALQGEIDTLNVEIKSANNIEHIEKVATEKADEIKAPVSEICGNAEELAASLVDDDSEVKPVEGFFLTSQRWH